MPQDAYDAGPADDVRDGGMHQTEFDGEKLLLLRDGDAIRAIAATCPHAGAPLAEGVRRGNRIVCPWHKAVFCIRTGALLEPPAVDPLARFDVQIVNGRVMLRRPDASKPPADVAADTRCFVVIGAGAAGALAAQTLREAGFRGPIVMLDQDNRVPYDRTVLSKYVLSGEQGGEKSPLQTQAFYRDQHIERRTATVVRLDARSRRIECADGAVLHYDAAVLATGSAPRLPDIPGADLGNVFLLRSRMDAEAILAQAERSRRAVILGASFIGMEVAASLRERGLDVTVIGKEAVPFEKLFGARIGKVFTALHARHGVAFRLGQDIGALEGGHNVTGVLLKNGERLPADLVVAGFGVKPNTDALAGLPLNEDGGVPVDAFLRVADGLYAAGDIASFPHRGDGDPIRVEHWRVAEQHGRVAAWNMLGQAVRYTSPPVFWTSQYLKRLDYIGHATDWDDVVIHGDLETPEFLAYYVKHGHVAAVAGFDRDRDTAAIVELFERQHLWTPDELGAEPASVLAGLEGGRG